jgi:hypothetical protein
LRRLVFPESLDRGIDSGFQHRDRDGRRDGRRLPPRTPIWIYFQQLDGRCR